MLFQAVIANCARVRLAEAAEPLAATVVADLAGHPHFEAEIRVSCCGRCRGGRRRGTVTDAEVAGAAGAIQPVADRIAVDTVAGRPKTDITDITLSSCAICVVATGAPKQTNRLAIADATARCLS